MKLHLITGNEREIFKYIYVNKNETVATNGSALGVIPTDSLFNKEFVEKIPEEGILIHNNDWKTLIDRYYDISWENNEIKCETPQKTHFFKIKKETEEFFFPKYKEIMPKEKNAKELPYIGIDFKLAYLLQDALDLYNCKLTFYGLEKGIKITDGYGESPNYGILMPVIV